MKNGLDVLNRRTIERREIPDSDQDVVDRNHNHPMQPNRVRPIRRTGAEHSPLGAGRISTRMRDQHVTTGAVKPGQDDDLSADLEIANPFTDVGIEDEPSLWRSFVALLWSAGPVPKWRLNSPYRLHNIRRGHRLLSLLVDKTTATVAVAIRGPIPTPRKPRCRIP